MSMLIVHAGELHPTDVIAAIPPITVDTVTHDPTGVHVIAHTEWDTRVVRNYRPEDLIGLGINTD